MLTCVWLSRLQTLIGGTKVGAHLDTRNHLFCFELDSYSWQQQPPVPKNTEETSTYPPCDSEALRGESFQLDVLRRSVRSWDQINNTCISSQIQNTHFKCLFGAQSLRGPQGRTEGSCFFILIIIMSIFSGKWFKKTTNNTEILWYITFHSDIR